MPAYYPARGAGSTGARVTAEASPRPRLIWPIGSLEVDLAQLGVVVKVGSRSAEGDAAVAEDVDAVGDLQDRTDFPLDDQDRDWAGGGTRTLYRRPTGLIEAI